MDLGNPRLEERRQVIQQYVDELPKIIEQLQRYRATRLGRKEIQQLSSTDPLAEYCSTPLIRSVRVENLLGDIQTDYDNL
jgi:hypothetical protein